MNEKLKSLGYTSHFEQEAALYDNLFVGRVSVQYRDVCRVICEKGELMASVSGRFRYDANRSTDYPTVGDFVMLDRETDSSGNAIIHHVLPRKSVFIRKAAGTSNVEQIVASNIDVVFICMSLNNDFNLRRLERYLSISWDSGATPVVVLTKTDLCSDVQARIAEAASVAMDVDIVTTSSLSSDGYSAVLKYIKFASTVAFIGSSGVGKSALINRLVGEDKFNVGEIGSDDKGRHTTTMRELVLLKNGGIVIDTPGMRELAIDNADLTKSFVDIEELAQRCGFRNCTHTKEPNCAVLQAIGNTTLTMDRLANYHKLQREMQYDGLGAKELEVKKGNEMFKDVGGIKHARKAIKKSNKHKW